MSDIDYHILRSVTARDLVRALLRDGFEFRRRSGSHERYAHEDGRRVTVPYTRRGDTFAIGTLRSIIERQARWTIDDLKRLELLPS
jgi:predicted RNA binding protein YcfA (HicA-like mRNA interferase family)